MYCVIAKKKDHSLGCEQLIVCVVCVTKHIKVSGQETSSVKGKLSKTSLLRESNDKDI
jgi:hypothetical protein